MTGTGLSTSLRSLVNSLNVGQTTLGYLSENIANVNTTGYTKKTVSQETRVANGVVLGVDIAEIRRSVDEFLVAANREQLSNFGQAEIKNTYFDRIQQFTLGDPNSSFTITNTINDFYTRLDDFANDPSSTIKKSLTITAAENLTNSIKSISNGVYNERLNADVQISSTVEELNNIFSSLADINQAIRSNSNVGGQIEQLLDARDVEIDKVKEIIDADISFNEFDQVTISISSAELLGANQQYTIDYDRLSSVDEFINDTPTNGITVTAIDTNGNKTGSVVTLLSASNDALPVDNIPSGKLRGLIDLRDTDLPTITDQLDNFTYTFADAFNEIHNNGSGFPPPTTLTGTESFTLNDEYLFSGGFRLSLVDENGSPLPNKYGDDLLPLELNFDEFDGNGNGKGTASVESIINEINNYYGVPSLTSTNVGDAHDIKAAAVSDSITSVRSTGTITFSGQPSVGESLDINGTTFTFVANGATTTNTQIELGGGLSGTLTNIVQKLNASSDSNVSVATYSVGAGSKIAIEYDQGGTTGDSFTLDASSTTTATASGATLAGGANVSGNFELDFEFSNFNSLGEDITLDIASYTISHGAYTSSTITPTFDANSVAGGKRERTNQSTATAGSLTVDLNDAGTNGLEAGETFTIDAVVAVTDASGNVSNETVTFTFTVPDPDEGIKNDRFSATAISGSGDGTISSASNNNAMLTAKLVDAKGNTITDNNTEGFLKLTTAGTGVRFSIDQLDSSHNGKVGAIDPSSSATSKGISHFFGLNNFFTFGGKQNNSSVNIDIRDDIKTNPALLTSGKAQLSTQTGASAKYSYELGSGSNSTALDLITLQDNNLGFSSAGGLPILSTTINSYITEIYNSASLKANTAENEYDKQSLLTNSLKAKIDDVSGVNIDEELALTIQIQNSYSASAKVLTVVRDLFDELKKALL